ncbi:hypothetical protein OQA88_3233 [Cercophora sp. LCS_1]
MPVPISTTANHAKTLKSLHIPGTPLLLANAYNATSASIIASHPSCCALATASYAFADIISKKDETLTLEDNLSQCRPIAAIAAERNLPLTVDIQDGYAPSGAYDILAGNAKRFINELGAAGFNLEDSWHESGEVMGETEAIERIKTVVETAKKMGVDDFVVNARSDTFFMGGELEESIRRGRLYLEAGATTVFIFWPRAREMLREDVKRVIDAFRGMVNIGCRLGSGLTTAELAGMGAARASVGPQLWLAEKGARGKGLEEEQVKMVVEERIGEVFGLVKTSVIGV